MVGHLDCKCTKVGCGWGWGGGGEWLLKALYVNVLIKKKGPIDSLISLHTFFKHVENSADVMFISCLRINFLIQSWF